MKKALLITPALATWFVSISAAQAPAPLAPPAPPAQSEPAPAPAAVPRPPRPPKPPRATAMRMLDVRGSYLGVGVADIDADRAKALKLPEPRGVEVTTVAEDSPAAKAGIKDGDVVLEYNGQAVESYEQFQRLVRETPPGRAVKIVISREGKRQTVTASVGRRQDYGFAMDPRFQADMQKFQQEMQKFGDEMSVWGRNFERQMQDRPRGLVTLRSGYLGVETESLNPQLAEYFGVKQGVLVRSVAKDSAAEKAGIKAGDVITKINDMDVARPSDITREIRSLQTNKTVPVTLYRNRQQMTVTVTVPERSSRAWMIGPGDIDVDLHFALPRIQIQPPQIDVRPMIISLPRLDTV